MDGNGRWAKLKKRPRIFGHRAGEKCVRQIIEHCAKLKIPSLTLFAFSTENWQRPDEEVGLLMELFLNSLKRRAVELNKNNIKLRIIGDTQKFSRKLQAEILKVEKLTDSNTGLIVNIAANYGGKWDIGQAARKMAEKINSGHIQPDEVDENTLRPYLSLSDQLEPDLFIRTGGEFRMSNFLIWQLAYSELYFTPVLWPDFDKNQLDKAIYFFLSRERRFGQTAEQLSIST